MTNNLHSHIKLASTSNSIAQSYQSGLIERQTEALTADKPKSTKKEGQKWYDASSNLKDQGSQPSVSNHSKKAKDIVVDNTLKQRGAEPVNGVLTATLDQPGLKPAGFKHSKTINNKRGRQVGSTLDKYDKDNKTLINDIANFYSKGQKDTSKQKTGQIDLAK